MKPCWLTHSREVACGPFQRKLCVRAVFPVLSADAWSSSKEWRVFIMISHYYLFLLGYYLCWCCESKKGKISACENTQRQWHQTALKEKRKKNLESSIPDTEKATDSGVCGWGKAEWQWILTQCLKALWNSASGSQGRAAEKSEVCPERYQEAGVPKTVQTVAQYSAIVLMRWASSLWAQQCLLKGRTELLILLLMTVDEEKMSFQFLSSWHCSPIAS